MTSDAATKFDFNGQAKALLKRLNPGGGLAPNPALALAAVEAALREAYARGQESARSPQPKRNLPAGAPAPAKPEPCEHEWEEAFLDGRDLGFRCANCGILQKDVQDHCNHFFVAVGGGEVCVACRKPKGRARS